MKKQYTPILFFLVLLFSGCSKDFLKSYDERIIGTWEIIDIDRYGFNGDDNLPFEEDDLVTFADDGSMTLQQSGSTYRGSWDIQRMQSGDENKKALHITAIDFTDQQVRSEYFNNIAFRNTNRFTAFINYNTRTYAYRFLRQ